MASLAGAGSAIERDRSRDRGVIRTWLIVVALMIVAMVVVGGATRLTNSGLSITEWRPISGLLPPLNESEWRDAFAKYQQIPEFRLVNPDMTVEGFQTIYWWEWAHRLLGRLIGVVVLAPLVFFWLGGRIEPSLKPKLVAVVVLGGLQAAAGWWMVASGLAERTDVSQYRLAIHLTLAAAILAYVVWVARGLTPTPSERTAGGARLVAALIVAVTFVQIFLGGLVAGLDGGLTFNTWPLMDGALVPSGLLVQSPWWRDLFENVATVQFDHRLGAYCLLALAVGHAVQARGSAHAGSAAALAGAVTLQAAIGIFTLVALVPVGLALLHQFGAVVVLWLAVIHLRAMRPETPLPIDRHRGRPQ
ncbi:MAG: COX15/CtaA family protein [Bauldia sp.]